MKKFVVYIFLVLFLFCSCKSSDTISDNVVFTDDVRTLIQPVFDMRPQQVKLIDSPADLSDIMQNSVSFQLAYENWKSYAEALEEFYRVITKTD